MKPHRLLIAILVAVLWTAASHVLAQGGIPAPATGVAASDTPGDEGNSITITWELSSDDDEVSTYAILRSSPGLESFEQVGEVPAGTSRYVDESGLSRGDSYYYQ